MGLLRNAGSELRAVLRAETPTHRAGTATVIALFVFASRQLPG
ncbi:MAG: hypothetical protein ACTHN3_13180 [Solirubrobacterales bacterium]